MSVWTHWAGGIRIWVAAVAVCIVGAAGPQVGHAADPATRPAETDAPDPRTFAYRFLFDDMRPADAPQGYRHMQVRESPDGRRVAFMSVDADRVGRVIVVDSQTKAETGIPEPSERVYESRDITHLQWDERGEWLYLVERATEGVRTQAEYKALTSEQLVAQIKEKDYAVLYRCRPGDAEAEVIEQVRGGVLALAAGPGRVRLINQSGAKGWGYVEVREYRDGKRTSLQTIHVAIGGKPIDYFWPTILCKRNELWFGTQIERPREPGDQRPKHPVYDRWLAMMDLDKVDSEPRLVLPDTARATWLPDEERMLIQRIENLNQPGEVKKGEWSKLRHRVSYVILRHDALDRPIIVASKVIRGYEAELAIAGFGHDGRKVYLDGMAQEVAPFNDLLKLESWRLYELSLPE